MALSYRRKDRVGDLILHEVSEMILKGEVKDPRVRGAVLTGVRCSDDLSTAWVYFTVMMGGNKREILEGFQKASGFIKRELWRRLRIKRVPELNFEYDATLEKGYRIDAILKEIGSEGNGEGS